MKLQEQFDDEVKEMRSLSETPSGIVKVLLTCGIGIKCFSANKLPIPLARRFGGKMDVRILDERSF